MTTTRKSTKAAAIVLTLTLLVGMFCIFGTATTSAATDRVSLYSSSVTFSKYGSSNREVFIKTNDNAANQEVYVHYCYMDNQPWQAAKAEYVTTLSDGSKIWKAVITSYKTQYAIKYVADGQEIWDNNNGKNYTRADVCGSAPVTVERVGDDYYNVPIKAVGFDCFPSFVAVPGGRAGILQEMLLECYKNGVSFYHVAYINYSHKESDIDEVLSKLKIVCETISK